MIPYRATLIIAVLTAHTPLMCTNRTCRYVRLCLAGRPTTHPQTTNAQQRRRHKGLMRLTHGGELFLS